MILSDIDIKDAAYQLIVKSNLPQLISGSVYKDARPANSTLEDIAISVLTGDASQTQEFVLNVNLFVQDVKRGNESIENTPRLRTLARACIGALQSSVENNGIWFFLESQRVMAVQDVDCHFINNRLVARVYTD